MGKTEAGTCVSDDPDLLYVGYLREGLKKIKNIGWKIPKLGGWVVPGGFIFQQNKKIAN